MDTLPVPRRGENKPIHFRPLFIATLLGFLCIGTGMLSGCASMLYGEGQELVFTSDPSKAKITIYGKPDEQGKVTPIEGVTPFVHKVKGHDQTEVIIEKEGYETQRIKLSTEGRPVSILGNAFLGGFLFGPFSTSSDVHSGAYYEYKPNSYFIVLKPKDGGPPALRQATTRSEIKQFVILSYDKIMAELEKGEGQYLESLLSLLKVPPDGRVDIIARIKGLSAGYPVIPEFAERVTDLAAEIPTQVVPATPVTTQPPQPEKLKMAQTLKGLGFYVGYAGHNMNEPPPGNLVRATGFGAGIDYRFDLTSWMSVDPYIVMTNETIDEYGQKSCEGCSAKSQVMGFHLLFWPWDGFFLGPSFGHISLERTVDNPPPYADSQSGSGVGFGIALGFQSSGGFFVSFQSLNAEVEFKRIDDVTSDVTGFHFHLGYRLQ